MVPKIDIIQSLICREYQAQRAMKDPSQRITPVIFGETNPVCNGAEVSSLVAKFNLYGTLLTGILSAVTSPKLGQISDRYGRTKVMAFTSLGMLVTEIITIAAAKMPDVVPFNWILLSYAFDGISGSFIAALALMHAYASDITPPAKRNVTFGFFQGSLFSGIALGPLIAASIIDATGDLVSVFYVATVAHSIFLLVVVFIVPESLSKERQMAAREKSSSVAYADHALSANGLRVRLKSLNLLAPLKTLWPTGRGSSGAVRRNLVFLAAVDTTMFGVAMGTYSIIVIYTSNEFGWGTTDKLYFVSIVNIFRVTNLIVVLPLLSRLLRGPRDPSKMAESGADRVDVFIIRAAIFIDALGYVGYSTSRIAPLFVFWGVMTSFGSMGSPTLQSALTKHVPPEQTGAVLGAMGLLHALARVVAPTIFSGIYSVTVGKFDQTVFVCLAATFGLAFVLSWFIRPHGRRFFY